MLRWIQRDGKMVLQQEKRTTYTLSGYEWQDVPEFKEPEKTVTITEKQFNAAWENSAGRLYILKKELGF